MAFFMQHTFTTYIHKFKDTRLWSFHIKIPDKVALPLKEKSKRVVCDLNGKHQFQCAILSSKEVGYFININQAIRKKLKLELNDEIKVTLTPDESKYGIPVPEVFGELLKQDPEFDKVFHALTLGKQRSLLHLIGTFKTEQKQLEKLMILRNYLVQVNGKLDYKELNIAFKQRK
jgi:uncharacterized protein YdeI (YjbR/CyaY-like superfamily)